MSTPIVAQAPIGGQRISSFGGVLAFIPFGNGDPNNYKGGNTEPSDVGQTILDCARWDLDLISIHDDTTDTQSFGACNSDKVAEDWILQARIIWDLRRPPDLITKNGRAITQDNFNAGFQFWAYLGDDANYPSDIGAQYYYSPSGKILHQKPIIDPNSKKTISIELAIKGHGRIFKMPIEVAQFGKYCTHLITRDEVF